MEDQRQTRLLVERAKAGDQPALERLLLDHYGPLAAHLARRLPASAGLALEVEDLIQQTFANAFVRMPQFQLSGDATFLAWLITIGENQLRDALRAQQRQKRGGGGVAPAIDPDAKWALLVEAACGASPTASALLAREEAACAVQVAVAALPTDQREAICLRYFEGRSLDETAARMQRTTGAVRGLVDRAKQALREALDRASLYLSGK